MTSRGGPNYRKHTSHVGVRKRLRKQAERDHAGAPMIWLGGILHFADSLQPVPGVDAIPKPNSSGVLGLAAARPEATPKPLSWSQEAALRRQTEHAESRFANHDQRERDDSWRWRL